jgi:glycosyltransferase involved in cell wall biosynthesis
VRLLLVTQYFHPEVGATQTRMREFARHLAALGHQVTVVCEFPNHPHGVIPSEYRGKRLVRDRLDGFDVLRVWVKASPVKNFKTRLAFYFSFMVMAVLGGLTLRGRFDAVIATSPPLPVAVSGWALAVLKRARFVLDVRDLWPEAAVALGELSNPRLIRAAEVVERFLYRHADRIVAVTEGFVAHIGPRCGDPAKVHLIPNGTITEVFTPDRVRPELRGELGLDGAFVCTFAGTMGIAQGLPFLLDLAKDLADVPDVRFLLIGTGPVRDALVARQRREGIANVVFHDQVPLDRVTEYLTLSDVLLVPLRADPVFDAFIPSKMFDFLACRKPIILGVDGEARRMLESRGGGLFARPEDRESYRRAILTLRADPELRAREAAAGYAWVTAEYTRAAQARRLETVLRECVAGGAR